MMADVCRQLVEPFEQAVKSFERYASRVAPRAESKPSAGNSPRGKRREGVMVANQNIEISKKGYAAFDKGDVETVLNDYDDSVEFVIPGNNAVSGTYRGKDGVKELFGKIAEQNFKITPSRFLADDDVVVVLSQVSAGGESGLQADRSPTAMARSSRSRTTGTPPCLNGSSAVSSKRRKL